jgi:hypothetical protein
MWMLSVHISAWRVTKSSDDDSGETNEARQHRVHRSYAGHPRGRILLRARVNYSLGVGAIYPAANVTPNAGQINLCHASESAANAHIDCLLLDSPDLSVKGDAFWPDALAKYMTLSGYAALVDGDLETKLLAGHLVILHGKLQDKPGLTHVMLVSLVIKAYCARHPGSNVPNAANDTTFSWICRGTIADIDKNYATPLRDKRGVRRELLHAHAISFFGRLRFARSRGWEGDRNEARS